MADFEDANTPSWDNNIQGHLNLRDAIRRKIDFVTPEGKPYQLQEKPRRSLSGHAVAPPKSTSRSTASRSPAASSTSPCIFSTTQRR
jgi:malate synthase